MPDIQGIELSRRFYAEVVAPWLAREFPDLRHAAALIGAGSELLGFDDEMSRDHDFCARVQLYVEDDALGEFGRTLVARFAEIAPASFLGAPGQAGGKRPAEACTDARHGLEIWTVRGALQHWLALDPDTPLDSVGWLCLAEQRLLSVTAGAVFRDDIGALTRLRERFAYFPRDVWLYKLACQWRRVAEEQAFVGRTGFVGDELGSRVIAARLVRDVMRLAFLICRQYAPYPKWFGSAFSRLSCAGELSPMLQRVLDAPDWRQRQAALADSYQAIANLHLAFGLPGSFQPRVGPYFERPFTVINADEISAAIRAEISDPLLRDLPIIGSLDQVTDSTPVSEAPGPAQAAMRALFDDVEARALEEA
jgi:hypothetical protein